MRVSRKRSAPLMASPLMASPLAAAGPRRGSAPPRKLSGGQGLRGISWWPGAAERPEETQEGVSKILLSSFSLVHRTRVSERARALIGEEELREVTRRCRQMYRSQSLAFLPKSPRRTRKVVEDAVVPYVEELNERLRKARVPYFVSVESEYESIMANHPTYFLQVEPRDLPAGRDPTSYSKERVAARPRRFSF